MPVERITILGSKKCDLVCEHRIETTRFLYALARSTFLTLQ